MAQTPTSKYLKYCAYCATVGFGTAAAANPLRWSIERAKEKGGARRGDNPEKLLFDIIHGLLATFDTAGEFDLVLFQINSATSDRFLGQNPLPEVN